MGCESLRSVPVEPGAERVRIHFRHPQAVDILAEALSALAPAREWQKVAVVCVGTDRSTGDSLGPLVGTLLIERGVPVPVYGTLEHPVHATNLHETLPKIARHPFVLAVDAGLSLDENVGQIVVKAQPLCPGAGVGRQLAPIGDACILGMVNVGGFFEMFVLQNTRLWVVWKMACVIAEAIAQVVSEPAEQHRFVGPTHPEVRGWFPFNRPARRGRSQPAPASSGPALRRPKTGLRGGDGRGGGCKDTSPAPNAAWRAVSVRLRRSKKRGCRRKHERGRRAVVRGQVAGHGEGGERLATLTPAMRGRCEGGGQGELLRRRGHRGGGWAGRNEAYTKQASPSCPRAPTGIVGRRVSLVVGPARGPGVCVEQREALDASRGGWAGSNKARETRTSVPPPNPDRESREGRRGLSVEGPVRGVRGGVEWGGVLDPYRRALPVGPILGGVASFDRRGP